MSFVPKTKVPRPPTWKSDAPTVESRARHRAWCHWSGEWISYAEYQERTGKHEEPEGRGYIDRGLRAHPQAIVHKIRRKLDGTWIGPR